VLEQTVFNTLFKTKNVLSITDFLAQIVHNKKMWKTLITLTLAGICLNGCALQRSAASDAWDKSPRWAHQGSKPTQVAKRNTKPVQKQASNPKTSLPDRKTRWQVDSPSIDSTQAQSEILETAIQYIGTPYKWAGATPTEGFDCSGFVYYVYSQHGFNMARTADKQFLQGQTVDLNALKPGDLVFFETYTTGISHVGIYAGNDLFIHAPKTGRTVSYDSLASGYYQSRYRGAKRL